MELEPKFGRIIQDKPNITAQLLHGSSGARAKIWSNYITRQAYLLQHSHSHTSVEVVSQNVVKLYTRQAYLLQHSHSHTSVELESQNLVKLYTRQSLHATAQPLPDFTVELESQNLVKLYTRQAYQLQHSHSKDPVELEPKFGQIIQQDKACMLQHSHCQTLVELESQNLVKLYSRQSLVPQHSYFKAPVELELKFGQIIQDKPNNTAQLLQGSSEARSQIVLNYTRQAYLLQHSHSHTSVELESQNLVKLYKKTSLQAATAKLP